MFICDKLYCLNLFSLCYSDDQIYDQLWNCQFLKRHSVLCSTLALYSPLRDLFLKINHTDVRSIKVLCECSELICQTERCRNSQVWRFFFARVQFEKVFVTLNI